MKPFILLLLLVGVKLNAQDKNASDFFKSHSLYRKVNNVLAFINKSNTIVLNDYEKSTIYALVTPIHDGSFTVSLKNQLPSSSIDQKQCKCFKVTDNRFIVFFDRSDENFGKTEQYKNNFGINAKEATSCNDLFKQLKNNKQPAIPVNVFAYSIFEEKFVYLEDLATFDALQYLEIEYDLNKQSK
ncbi:hypothetical protein MTQ00_09055 [Chryseobacterium sp. B21-037]|uniref:hypothetical protein n=1 Tax=unclassified Chryseobacterium TaxID=2593645 RepID=UPI001552FFAC|nr:MULTISPECIES: hypothetical protein [unclassified Chryseobacterium]MDC8104686.1 hypothetical protein [Chryseobacterium sp. B21-037]